MTDDDKELDRIAAAAARRADGDGRPPRVQHDMGHYGISIDAAGLWHHGGTPFPRVALAKLFATVLKRDEAGDYWLETPVERGRVDVADAPFVAVAMEVEGADHNRVIRFRDTLDQVTTLDAAHPLRVAFDPETAEPRPYVLVRDRLEALLARTVYYELAELAEEAPTKWRMVVWSAGAAHDLGPMEEA